MKTLSLLFLALFLRAATADFQYPLADIYGKPIENGGGPYRIRAAFGTFGSNVVVGRYTPSNSTCPVDVVLDSNFIFDYVLTSSFTFTTPARIRYLSYSFPLSISSPEESPCGSTGWTVDESRGGLITTGAGGGLCFRIAQHPSPRPPGIGLPYQLQYCCNPEQTCLPIYAQGGNLAVGDANTRPLEVGFVRVEQEQQLIASVA